MPHTVVIADDVTGANDIGIMYAKAGLTALVYSFEENDDIGYADCDVLILDTDSRFDTGEKAYDKVYQALQKVPKKGVRQYISKQCSVFRGNIGAEFDAMLDALSEEFSVVVLGFPANGRTTLHSRHYVNGALLEESQFKNDPVHPMTESNLVEILKKQTRRSVGGIHYEVYDQGKAAVEQALKDAKRKVNYCIMDVRDNRDLEFLAEILKNEKILCGSSALSEYLACLQAGSNRKKRQQENETSESKVFCVAGSLTLQTCAQTAYMKAQGYPVFEMDTRKLFEEEKRMEELDRLVELVDNVYHTGDFAMIHSMNDPAAVAQTKGTAAELGYDNTEVSTIVSSAISEVSDTIIERHRIRNIISCGGDTSASLCAKLKIRGMKVLEEIESGLPTCRSVEEPFYRMVLKSGSFGSREFIEKSIAKLCGE